MKFKFLLSLVLLVCGFSILSFATTIYVNGSAACFQGMPSNYPTIQAAINAASNGDTIIVCDNGSAGYSENDIINKSINLYGNESNVFVNASVYTQDVFKITSNYVNITNFTLGGSFSASALELDSNYSKVSGLTIPAPSGSVYGAYQGIYLYYGNNNTITNNNISNTTYAGIDDQQSSNNAISNNSISNTQYSEIGIFLSGSDSNVVIANNTFWNDYSGIYFQGPGIQNNLIYNNSINNSHYGIYLQGFTANGVQFNNITLNSLYNSTDAMYVDLNASSNSFSWNSINYTYTGIDGFSSNNNYTNNEINDSTYALSNVGGANNTFSNNSVYQTYYGIYLQSSTSDRALLNFVYDSTDAVYLINSSNSTISSNFLNYTYTGIDGFSSNSTLVNNTITNGDFGVSDDGQYGLDSNNNLSNNSLIDDSYGVYLYLENNDSCNANLIFNSSDYGFYVLTVTNTSLANNYANNASYVAYISNSTNVSALSNTFVDSSDGMGLYISNLTVGSFINDTISNISINGVYLYNSSHILLSNSTISNTGAEGIYLFNTSSSTILLTQIYNVSDASIWVDAGSSLNNISNNTIFNTSFGIAMWSYGYSNLTLNPGNSNSFSNNLISNSTYGFSLYNSTSNNFTSNIISSSVSGILIENMAILNNISNNVDQNSTIADLYVDPTSCSNLISNLTGTGNLPINYTNQTVHWGNFSDSEIELCSSNNSVLTNITINGTHFNNGFVLVSSNNASIYNSSSSGNYYGFYLNSTTNDVLVNDSAKNNLILNLIVDPQSVSGACNQNISNLVGTGNLPINYSNSTISWSNIDDSEIELCNASNSSLTNVTVNGNGSSIALIDTDFSNISNSLSSGNYYGIYLMTSSLNNFTNISSENSNQFEYYSSNSSLANFGTNFTLGSIALDFSNANDVASSNVSAPSSDPTGFIDIGKYLNITGPSNSSISLSVHYSDSDVADLDPSTLGIEEFTGSSWSSSAIQLESVFNNPSAQTVSANLSDLGSYIFAPFAAPYVPSSSGRTPQTISSLMNSFSASCSGNLITVTSRGSPVAGATVLVDDPVTFQTYATGTTDSSGNFHFNACGDNARISTFASGYASDITEGSLVSCAVCMPSSSMNSSTSTGATTNTSINSSGGTVLVSPITPAPENTSENSSNSTESSVPILPPSMIVDSSDSIGSSASGSVSNCPNCTIQVTDPNGVTSTVTPNLDGSFNIPLTEQGQYQISLIQAGNLVSTQMLDSVAAQTPAQVPVSIAQNPNDEGNSLLIVAILIIVIILVGGYLVMRKKK